MALSNGFKHLLIRAGMVLAAVAAVPVVMTVRHLSNEYRLRQADNFYRTVAERYATVQETQFAKAHEYFYRKPELNAAIGSLPNADCEAFYNSNDSMFASVPKHFADPFLNANGYRIIVRCVNFTGEGTRISYWNIETGGKVTRLGE